MRSGVNQALRRFGEGRDYTITGQIMDVAPFVVAVRNEKDVAAGGPPGMKVVQRVADHQHVYRRHPRRPLAQSSGIGSGFGRGRTSPLTMTSK
jgi:hypothetical protein